MTARIQNQWLPQTVILAVAWWLGMGLSVRGESYARVWEEGMVLPTVKVAPADLNPRFYAGRTYQGAKATFYPYPVTDQLTDSRDYVEYKAVHLENPYLKLSILPELGGRIFAAVDKGNNYDFFYRQHVIKPALIGMLGAWISGGVEWNVPHHHRASSFMPVDYTVESSPDGSQTLWVGETELRHRMKWIIGLTLHPDRSYIEMTVKLFNRTPESQAFLFWINSAVHANTNYQVIFPPSTEWAVQHGKPEFVSWPIGHQVYGGTDYTKGIDISWWKNHPSPVSFFAWNCAEDFFGGYDHGKQAGVVQISNHHVSPGKKFFEWGNSPEGEMWDRILTDADGPYLELMAGSFSDNQPDYSWCQPHEVKVLKHYWYPIRRMGGVKNANLEAAVNLETSNRVVRLAFNTTSERPEAHVLLQSGNRILVDKMIRISPQEPFATELLLPEGIAEESLAASLRDTTDHLIISYQPAKPAGSSMPKPVKRPVAPKDIPNSEELYLTGLRIEQLYSPAFDPVPYYQEAIRRDPGDYRANTALGILYCRQGRYQDAEPLVRAALARATQNYIRPKDGEAAYYLGVALRGQGKLEEASEAFYQAIWGQAWKGAGYFALAELASLRGRFPEALDLVDRSLHAGDLNPKAWELKTTLLARLGRPKDAIATAEHLLTIDPLSARAWHDQLMVSATGDATGPAENALLKLTAILHGNVQEYLEMAIDYANAGFYTEATQVLETYLAQSEDRTRVYPLVYYYLSYFYQMTAHPDPAKEHRLLAAQMPTDYCFPFQQEAELILRDAMEQNPLDARAPYYLGNLLFDHQPLKAIAAWETAVQLDAKFALAYRNLGLARAQTQKDLPGAIACIEKAAALDPMNSRLYYELDFLYESAGAPLQKRLNALQGRLEMVTRRDDATTRLVSLLTAAGESDQALRLLRSRHFRNWEGSSELHDLYVNACLRQGISRLQNREPAEALKSFESALEYPLKQEVGRPKRERRSGQIHHYIGLAQSALGAADKAKTAFEKSASIRETGLSEEAYFKALSLQAIGKPEDATKILQDLVSRGLADANRVTDAVDYFAKFGEKRAERVRQAQALGLAGLGYLGQGKTTEANAQFAKALELDPSNLLALMWKDHASTH